MWRLKNQSKKSVFLLVVLFEPNNFEIFSWHFHNLPFFQKTFSTRLCNAHRNINFPFTNHDSLNGEFYSLLSKPFGILSNQNTSRNTKNVIINQNFHTPYKMILFDVLNVFKVFSLTLSMSFAWEKLIASTGISFVVECFLVL